MIYLLWSGILFSIILRAAVVTKLVLLAFSPLINFKIETSSST